MFETHPPFLVTYHQVRQLPPSPLRDINITCQIKFCAVLSNLDIFQVCALYLLFMFCGLFLRHWRPQARPFCMQPVKRMCSPPRYESTPISIRAPLDNETLLICRILYSLRATADPIQQSHS